MPDLAKSERIKMIIVSLWKKGQKKDAPDKRLLANRQHKAISRRLGRMLQDFFATNNTAYGDDVRAGVGIDPDKRAYHMPLRSDHTDDQINHTYGFVHDPKAATLDTRKTQEHALRFYDKPWDVDRHRDSSACMGRYSRTNVGTCPYRSICVPRTDIRRRILLGPMLDKATTRKSPGDQITLQQKMDGSTMIDATLPLPDHSIQPKSGLTVQKKLVWKPTEQEILTGSLVILSVEDS